MPCALLLSPQHHCLRLWLDANAGCPLPRVAGSEGWMDWGQVTISSADSSTVGIPAGYLAPDPKSKVSLDVLLKRM